jgi:hypothetical protein
MHALTIFLIVVLLLTLLLLFNDAVRIEHIFNRRYRNRTPATPARSPTRQYLRRISRIEANDRVRALVEQARASAPRRLRRKLARQIARGLFWQHRAAQQEAAA